MLSINFDDFAESEENDSSIIDDSALFSAKSRKEHTLFATTVKETVQSMPKLRLERHVEDDLIREETESID